MSKAEYWTEKFNSAAYDEENDYEEFMTWQDEAAEWTSESYDELENVIVNHGKWDVTRKVTIKFDDDSHMRLFYNEPATEEQLEQSYNYNAQVVEPYEVTVIKYRPVEVRETAP